MRTLLGRALAASPAAAVVDVAIHRDIAPAGVAWYATAERWVSAFFPSFDQLDDAIIAHLAGRLYRRVPGVIKEVRAG